VDRDDKDRDDTGFEILDLGRGNTGGPGRTPRELPPLDLAELSGHDDRPQPRGGPWSRLSPGWRRRVAAATAFVLGLAAGAYVWDARSDAADLVAEAGQVELLVGWFGLEPAPTREAAQATVTLHNAGPRDVDVLAVRPTGWAAVSDAAPAATTARPAEWTEVGIAADPICDAPVPDQLEVEVRTGQGESSVEIALPPGRAYLDWLQELLCGGFELFFDANVNRGVELIPSEPGTLRMIVTFRVFADTNLVEVTAASAAAAGLRAEAVGLPVEVPGSGEAVVPLELEWHVDTCARTSELGEVAADVELHAADRRATVEVQLPHRAIAMLGRFVAEECDA
jgi:hypothetical protein